MSQPKQRQSLLGPNQHDGARETVKKLLCRKNNRKIVQHLKYDHYDNSNLLGDDTLSKLIRKHLNQVSLSNAYQNDFLDIEHQTQF